MGPEISLKYEFAEIEFQNSGFSCGEPYRLVYDDRHELGRGVETVEVPVPRLQL